MTSRDDGLCLLCFQAYVFKRVSTICLKIIIESLELRSRPRGCRPGCGPPALLSERKEVLVRVGKSVRR